MVTQRKIEQLISGIVDKPGAWYLGAGLPLVYYVLVLLLRARMNDESWTSPFYQGTTRRGKLFASILLVLLLPISRPLDGLFLAPWCVKGTCQMLPRLRLSPKVIRYVLRRYPIVLIFLRHQCARVITPLSISGI